MLIGGGIGLAVLAWGGGGAPSEPGPGGAYVYEGGRPRLPLGFMGSEFVDELGFEECVVELVDEGVGGPRVDCGFGVGGGC